MRERRRDRLRALLGRRRATEPWSDACSPATASTAAMPSRASPSCAARFRAGARHPRHPARPRSSAVGGRADEAALAPPASEVELGRARACRSRATARAAWPEGGQARAAMGGRARRAPRPRSVLDRGAYARDARSRCSCARSTRGRDTRAGSTTRGRRISSSVFGAWRRTTRGVMMIGHNPGLHELVALLAPPGPTRSRPVRSRSCGSMSTTGRIFEPGAAELVQLVVPRELAG